MAKLRCDQVINIGCETVRDPVRVNEARRRALPS